MRLAAIDIGTNSLHMIVVQVRPDFSFEIIDREKEMVRLGAGGLEGRSLTDSAMDAAERTLAKFKRLAVSHQVDEVLAVATSAVREARNGREFLTRIEQQVGIRARAISATEEARLIHRAAVYGVNLGGGRAVVIDVGGGSTEITLGPATGPDRTGSFKLGTIRLTERFVRSDPLSRAHERKLVKDISAHVTRYLEGVSAQGFDRVIGTSGTILSIGAMALAQSGYPATEDLHHVRVPARQIHRLRKLIIGLDMEQRLRLAGLDPRRVDLIVAGAILVDTILRALGADELTLCELALREGVVLDYIDRHPSRIERIDRYPDIRRRSVMELGERCGFSPDHAQQSARLALSLFDQTRRVHELDDRAREWLEYAALVHDIGQHISYPRHHHHSYYLIKNGDLRGFEPDEIDVIALVARYHRRGTPKKRHREYGALKRPLRRAVKALSALLRVAETLDRSHASAVEQIDLRDHPDQTTLRLHSRGDIELELWAAARQTSLLEKMLGKPVRLEPLTQTYAEQPHHAAHLSGEAARRRGHRRVGEDHAAGTARQVALRRRTSGVPHRVELVRPGESGHEGGQEEKRAYAHDLQPAARHRLR